MDYSVYSFLSISFYERLFNRINKRFPNGIVRAKGFVLESNGQWGKIDYVNGKVHFETVLDLVRIEITDLFLFGGTNL